MSTHTKTPQLLPWLAKKADIGAERANALWLEAVDWAGQRARPGSSACHKLAVERLRHLAAAESLCEDLASFGWRPWARAQAQFWALSAQLLQQSSSVLARTWRLLGSPAQPHRFG